MNNIYNLDIDDGGVMSLRDVRLETMSGYSWVRLIHEPTGLSAECREFQSIRKNEEKAWKNLETLCMQEVCKRAGQQARKDAFAKGLPVCYMKDGRIVNEYSDGRIVPVEN